MPKGDPTQARGTRRLFMGAAVIAVVLALGFTVWPFLTQNQLGTPNGGANPATTSDTVSRGAPAQNAAESTVGKSDPAGQEDTSGGRARAIKQSSQALQLDPQQHQQIKDVILTKRVLPRSTRLPSS